MKSQTITEPIAKPVDILMSDKSITGGTLLLWGQSPDDTKLVQITLRFANREISRAATSYLVALNYIRSELEKESQLLRCYGNSRNVSSSGMGASMGNGEMAYRCYLGKKGDMKDLVSIFDSGQDVDPCSLKEQLEFRRQWLLSIGVDPDRKVYPWKILFLQHPVKTTRLFFKERLNK